MKKIIVPFVAAFGVSLGAATGMVMMRAPKAPPAATANLSAAAKPDSSATPTDSVTAHATDSSAVAPSTQTATAASDSSRSHGPASQPANKSETASVRVTDTAPRKREVAEKEKQPPAGSQATTAPHTAVAVAPRVIAGPASDSIIGQKLAQVFGAMQPKDAARVLEQMDDSDVRSILGSLSSKKQAAILGSFPTQRAATILQATLRTASSGGRE